MGLAGLVVASLNACGRQLPSFSSFRLGLLLDSSRQSYRSHLSSHLVPFLYPSAWVVWQPPEYLDELRVLISHVALLLSSEQYGHHECDSQPNQCELHLQARKVVDHAEYHWHPTPTVNRTLSQRLESCVSIRHLRLKIVVAASWTPRAADSCSSGGRSATTLGFCNTARTQFPKDERRTFASSAPTSDTLLVFYS